MHIEQSAQLMRRVFRAHLRNTQVQSLQLLHHLVTRRTHTLDFRLHIGLAYEVMRHFHAAGSHQNCSANSHAA